MNGLTGQSSQLDIDDAELNEDTGKPVRDVDALRNDDIFRQRQRMRLVS